MSASLTGDALALRLLYAARCVARTGSLVNELEEALLWCAPGYGVHEDEDLHQEATADDVAAWLTTGSVGGM